MGCFPVSAFSAHADVFHIRLPELENRGGINILSCSRPILNKHLNYSLGSSFLKNPTASTNPAMVQTLTPSNLVESSEVYVNVINFENSLYCPESVNNSTTHAAVYRDLLSGLDELSLKQSMCSLVPLYQTLIHLTLFNLQQMK
jgi:hypothetical protein